MAFDDPTRRRLFKTVTACRNLLTEDFDEQLRSRFGVYADEGTVREIDRLTSLDDAQRETARVLRERIDHLAAGQGKDGIREAVRRILREQAFTVLNRFAALRMAEERGIISPSVGGGLQSTGFRVFEQSSGAALGSQYERYLIYLNCLFDELSLDLGVLFDRSDAMGLLFPGEDALRNLFAQLNHPEIASLWTEDEAIGWIYQYYNDPEERKQMRKDSATPRTSRELAVRNQFFTPRYVVEFLTDNTLGRIWYEMTQGETKLKEQCRYLVRRPTEIFLGEGESPPAEEQGTKNQELTQEELLRQPVHIPHRPLKDPRTILMLDPACGSMHFGLYAFDLFEVIYDEAWALEEKLGADAQSRPPGMKSLHTTYAGKVTFLKDVPRLIIEHNLHGIDIDPRCAQIAGLSLWLRAQKAWQRLGLKPAERPAIKRSNIVCAEPMPGEKELLREFVEREFPVEERAVCLRLLEAIFDKMQLAGEAGSLLKIEEEIRSAIEDARDAWQKLATKPPELFTTTELNQHSTAPELTGLEQAVSSLTTDFWERVEERIYAALRDYSEQAEDGGGFQRRLFAEDAARGFAFIDVCRKRYDVALMNPPFGEPSKGARNYIAENYPRTKNDIYAAFVEQWVGRLSPSGRLGALTSRTGFFLSSFEKWREEILLEEAQPKLFADLGDGVLDSAMVETAAYVLEASKSSPDLLCIRLLTDVEKGPALEAALRTLSTTKSDRRIFAVLPSDLGQVPGTPFAYWVTPRVRRVFGLTPGFENGARTVKQGLATADDFRFIRLAWETPSLGARSIWFPIVRGGSFARFYASISNQVNWQNDGEEIKAWASSLYDNSHWSRIIKSVDFYFRPGLTWPLRGIVFSAQAVPAGCIFSVGGKLATCENPESLATALGVLNSKPFDFFIGFFAGKVGGVQYESGLIGKVPFVEDASRRIAELAKAGWNIGRSLDAGELTSHAAVVPALLTVTGRNLTDRAASSAENFASDKRKLTQIQSEIDALAFQLYGLTETDLRVSSDSSELEMTSTSSEENPDADESLNGATDAPAMLAVLLDYFFGVAFGRWDIRYATGEQAAPELPDPFAPLPVCPPGQLQNAQGLPARPEDVPADYPLRISWPGILVDDENHPEDIVARVREALTVTWGDKADTVEADACEILGVKAKPKENLDALRVYFRDPSKFFKDHIARYSKSRRKAPIYWPLSTASGSYTLWIYYHRLDSQTLYTCVSDFIDPKRENVGRDIEALRSRIGTEGTTEERERLEDLIDFHAELKKLRVCLLEVAGLPYRPDLNDGVQLTAAPLWQCFRHGPWQKVLEQTWDELAKKEKYDWAHLVMCIWPERVVPKCSEDRSLAIAHGFDDLLWVPDEKKDRRRALKNPEEELKLLKKAGHSKEDLEKFAGDVAAAEKADVRDFLWIEQPKDTWRRRKSPREEIAEEIARRQGK